MWDLPRSGIKPCISCIGRWILHHWATREAPNHVFKWPMSILKGFTFAQLFTLAEVRWCYTPRPDLEIFNISLIKIATFKIFSAIAPKTRLTHLTQTWMHLPHSTKPLFPDSEHIFRCKWEKVTLFGGQLGIWPNLCLKDYHPQTSAFKN